MCPFLFSKLLDIHVGLAFLFSVSVNQLVYFQNSFERNLTQFEVGIIFQFGLNLDSVLYSYIHLVERMSKLLTVLLQLYSVSLIRVFPHYKSALIEFFNAYNLQSYHSFSSAWN